MGEHQVLFCPFCRECFEAETHCPDHELELVAFSALPRSDHEEHEPDQDDALLRAPDERLGTFDLGQGRGLVAAGALFTAGALLLRWDAASDGLPLRTYELARARPSLWTLMLVGFTALYVLARRRTPEGLRGQRVLVPFLALLSPAACLAVIVRTGGPTSWGPALYAVALGSILLLLGGLRLGAADTTGR